MQTVIPAQPGFNVVFPISDYIDDIEVIKEVILEPVIGWLVETDGRDRAYTIGPLTATCGLRGEDDVIQKPDGTFVDAGQDYNTLEEVIKELNAQLERDRIRHQTHQSQNQGQK